MKRSLNDNIIAMIKSRITDVDQLSPFLMQTLHLGKEAIYRRLRGDVLFTFNEVAALSMRLGFSIDNLSGIAESERLFFDMAVDRDLPPTEVYYTTMMHYAKVFADLGHSKNVTARFINNHLPFIFTIHFETLSKFRYYKIQHQQNGIASDCTMASLTMPAKVVELHKSWSTTVETLDMESIYIIDNNLFLTTCQDIDFFYRCQLISPQELVELKKELTNLVNYLEKTANTGLGASGAPVHLYLLPFDLGVNYMYFEFDNNVSCYTHIYSIDHLKSHDRRLCELHKIRIDQLRRYSVYITQSGEIVRLAYFKQQRHHIDQIGISSPI